jgi:hypothetical protein
MATPTPDRTAARIDDLERQVSDLRRRLAALESRLVDPRSPNPIDRETVNQKVKYDWQS